MTLTTGFGAILALLDRHGVDHVVLGGFAALLPDAPPDVFDVGLVPAPDAANLERLTAALLELELARIRGRDPVDVAIPLWRGFLATGRVPGQVSLRNGPGGIQIALQASVPGLVGIDHAALVRTALPVHLAEPAPVTVAVVAPEVLALLPGPGHQADVAALRQLLDLPDPTA